ncbi:unnamed protein product [Arabidopsis halleri]
MFPFLHLSNPGNFVGVGRANAELDSSRDSIWTWCVLWISDRTYLHFIQTQVVYYISLSPSLWLSSSLYSRN